MTMKNISIFIAILAIFSVSSIVSAQYFNYGSSGKAFFSLTPGGNIYSEGETFPIHVKFQTDDPVTSFRLNLSYDSSLINVVNIDHGSSNFPYWWESSNRSKNAIGDISLQASIHAPGYQGNGDIATITFKAIESGRALIAYAADSLILDENDRNVLDLSNSNSASVLIGKSSSGYTFTQSPSIFILLALVIIVSVVVYLFRRKLKRLVKCLVK